MNTRPAVSEMSAAVRRRDRSYDGIFYTAVATTGIFCRPSCPARQPRPDNVTFYATVREALHAGYRPCKRCRPLDTNGRPPDWVRQLLSVVGKNAQQRLADADLRTMAIDPSHARRYFKQHYGMTFQAYSRALRLGRALSQIRTGQNITATGYDHGFDSHSGFRDAFGKLFGHTPGQTDLVDCIVSQLMETPLGPMVACATNESLCLLEFTDRRAMDNQIATLRKRFDMPIIPGTNAHLDLLQDELNRYFEGTLQQFTVPLTHPGTPFQESVWQRLRRIPYGTTVSYEQIARDIKCPSAQRAVGTANGANRIAIVIPCHRVVNRNGQLGGYGGGLWRKQFLLDLEQGRRTATDQ